MSARPCPRLWQAEACEDARLSRPDCASFERHAELCSECAAERAEIARVRALGSRLPEAASAPLRRRFLRNQLLARANDLTLGKSPGTRPLPKRAALALAGALAAGAAFAWLEHAPDRRGPEPLGEPVFEIAGARAGRWHRDQPGPKLRLRFDPGEYSVHVRKLQSGQSFVVNLPDGELEVRGTRFTIELDARRTLRVAVTEGLVSLRLRGEREMLLGAGDNWPSRAAQLAPSAAPAQPAPSAGASSATRKSSAAGRTTLAPRSTSAPPAARASNAAFDFAQAMAAFSTGDFATAEQRFSAFEVRYPTSGHLEDILFLRAFASSRRGDHAKARALAELYLKRYPNGFRAPDARSLAR